MQKRPLYICRTPYNLLIAAICAIRQGSIDVVVDDPYGRRLVHSRDALARLVDGGIVQRIYEVTMPKGINDGFIPSYGKPLQMIHEARTFRRINLIPDIQWDRITFVYVFNDWDGILRFWLWAHRVSYVLLEPSRGGFSVVLRTTPSAKQYGDPWSLKQRFMAWLFPYIGPGLGQNPFCSAIEVDHLEGIPSQMLKKARTVSKEEIFQSLTEIEKHTLVHIFAPKLEVYTGNRDATLLLTRPFSGSDRWLPNEETQKKLIIDVIQTYGTDGPILVKPHPRDRFDYVSQLRSFGVQQLDSSIPVELFSLLPNCRFKKVVSICASCVTTLARNFECIYLDLSWFKMEREKFCTKEQLKTLNPL